ncbi:hypothetical protein J6590_052695 [Homalodisca vitripennis]|nr:hypothetical protein J6590_052695 [Homalodisca vitripennis]
MKANKPHCRPVDLTFSPENNEGPMALDEWSLELSRNDGSEVTPETKGIVVETKKRCSSRRHAPGTQMYRVTSQPLTHRCCVGRPWKSTNLRECKQSGGGGMLVGIHHGEKQCIRERLNLVLQDNRYSNTKE